MAPQVRAPPAGKQAASWAHQFFSSCFIVALPSYTAAGSIAVLPVNSSAPHTRIISSTAGEVGREKGRFRVGWVGMQGDVVGGFSSRWQAPGGVAPLS